MSDPLAFAQYEPNRPTAAEPPVPASDPDAFVDALVERYGLEPWQRDLAIRREAIERMSLAAGTIRTGFARASARAAQVAELLGSRGFLVQLDELERDRARVSASWAEYHRRRR